MNTKCRQFQNALKGICDKKLGNKMIFEGVSGHQVTNSP